MKYISIFVLTTLGTGLMWIIAELLSVYAFLHLHLHLSLGIILPNLFSTGLSVWYYRKVEPSKMKAFALAVIPFVLFICIAAITYYIYIIFILIGDDSIQFQD